LGTGINGSNVERIKVVPHCDAALHAPAATTVGRRDADPTTLSFSFSRRSWDRCSPSVSYLVGKGAVIATLSIIWY
jgi:hypothetical protein